MHCDETQKMSNSQSSWGIRIEKTQEGETRKYQLFIGGGYRMVRQPKAGGPKIMRHTYLDLRGTQQKNR